MPENITPLADLDGLICPGCKADLSAMIHRAMGTGHFRGDGPGMRPGMMAPRAGDFMMCVMCGMALVFTLPGEGGLSEITEGYLESVGPHAREAVAQSRAIWQARQGKVN